MCLAQLPSKYRAAYLLWTQEELPYEEIAQILGISEETARWRVCKARQGLVEMMSPYLPRLPAKSLAISRSSTLCYAAKRRNSTMKCRETKYWLYSLRPNTSWPVDVVTHLQGCVKCQQVQARLKQIDIGRQRADQRDGRLREQSPAPRTAGAYATAGRAGPPRVLEAWLPFVRFVGFLTAAAALMVLGWFLGRGEFFQREPNEPLEKVKLVEVIKEKPIEVIREKIVKIESPGDRHLFAALLKRNARLVQSPQVKGSGSELANSARHGGRLPQTCVDADRARAARFVADDA